jgi:hypothetical protein
MNMLDRQLAAHEIDRRLRDADHHRRIRWGRAGRYVGSRRSRRDCMETA